MKDNNILKEFRLAIVVRLTIILAVMAFCAYAVVIHWGQTPYTMLFFWALILLAWQTYSLFRFIDRTNREVTQFISAIRFSDFSASFTTERMSGSYMELNSALTDVIREFKKARAEKEENNRYLHTVIQHVGIGLISFTGSGRIEFINNAAKKILQIQHAKDMGSLNDKNPVLTGELLTIKTGQKKIVRLNVNNEPTQIYLYASEFKMRNENFTLVSMQNIQSEMEEQEMEAWQKLIRVLTHEIMNSVTPISSLAGTMQSMLTVNNDASPLTAEALGDFRLAVDSIKNRSEGLIHFVENYRSLARTLKPEFRIVPANQLFMSVLTLMEAKLKEAGINTESVVNPATLELTVDPLMIEQMLINLILNSIHALKNTPDPVIRLRAEIDQRGRASIQIIDNGEGIDELAIEKIFIPFFTTKKEGSGIGLSLSRQIMRAHNGSIRAHSVPGAQTVFTLRF